MYFCMHVIRSFLSSEYFFIVFCIMDNYFSHAQLFPKIGSSSTAVVNDGKPKSFVEAVSKTKPLVLPPSSCSPHKKGAYVSVRVNSEALQSRLELCRYSLIGRLILAKGDKPYALQTLKEKLSAVWKIASAWRLISLGKGYYQILLSNHEEQKKVWGMGSLNLKLGIWRLQPWERNFNPYSQKNTNVQVWVRLWDLPWVYWHPQILSDIARAIGVPLRLDQTTVNGDYGHYARVLVDVDLKNPLLYQVEIDCEDECGFVTVEYENLPDFCTTCSSIGHPATRCKLNKPLEEMNEKKIQMVKAKGVKTVFKHDSDEDAEKDMEFKANASGKTLEGKKVEGSTANVDNFAKEVEDLDGQASDNEGEAMQGDEIVSSQGELASKLRKNNGIPPRNKEGSRGQTQFLQLETNEVFMKAPLEKDNKLGVQGGANDDIREAEIGDDFGAREVKHSLSVEVTSVHNVESVALGDNRFEHDNMDGFSSSGDHASSLNTSDLAPTKVFQGEEWQQVSRRHKKGEMGVSRPITRSCKNTSQ